MSEASKIPTVIAPRRRLLVTFIETAAAASSSTGSREGLRRAVAMRYGSAASFETFDWSGTNSHEERLAAAQRLGARLEVQAVSNPDAHRALIAPGDSGNVAMYAARNLADPATMPHVACIGTPAIEVTPSTAGTRRFRAMLAFFELPIVVLVVVLIAALVAMGLGYFPAGASSKKFAAGLALMIVFFTGFGLAMRRLVLEIHRRAERQAMSYSWPHLPASRVLLVTGEETAARDAGAKVRPGRGVVRTVQSWLMGLALLCILGSLGLTYAQSLLGAEPLIIAGVSIAKIAAVLSILSIPLFSLVAVLFAIRLAALTAGQSVMTLQFTNWQSFFDARTVARPSGFKAAAVDQLSVGDAKTDPTRLLEDGAVQQKIFDWLAELPVSASAPVVAATSTPETIKSEPPYFVTLVHGTYARGTAWIQPESDLRRALSSELGPAQFDVFEWSGENSHRARLEAGNELAIRLHASTAKYPRAHHVVIAHSHGGNVALYAAKRARDETLFPDIACLATPFLQVRPAHHARLYFWFWGIVVLMLLASLVHTGLSVLTDLRAAGANASVIASSIIIAAIPALLIGSFLAFFWRALSRKISNRIADLAWPDPLRSHVLTLSYKFDEAGVFLRTLGGATTGASRRLWRFSGRALLFALACVLLAQAFTYAMPLLVPVYPSLETWGAGPFAKLVELIVFLSFGLGALSAVLAFGLPILRGHPYGFGWEEPIDALFIDVDAVDRPDDLKPWSGEHYRVEIGEFGKNKKMAHTVIYDDPRMQQKLVEWIKATREKSLGRN